MSAIVTSNEIRFNLAAELTGSRNRSPSAARSAAQWESGQKGRFVVVGLKKNGCLPKTATVSQWNSGNNQEEAEQKLAYLASVNQGDLKFVIVDRCPTAQPTT